MILLLVAVDLLYNIFFDETNFVTMLILMVLLQEGEDSEEEGGDDDIGWVGYKDVGDLGRGKSLVTFEKPKRIKGFLCFIPELLLDFIGSNQVGSNTM